MYDVILKRLFANPIMVEEIIRSHLPDWAERLDFSTLRQDPTELIGEKALKRLPDVAWSARSKADDTDFLLLLEFQGASDPDMAARTTASKVLAVQAHRRKQRSDKQRPPRAVEIEVVVLYHGAVRWTASRGMDEIVRGRRVDRYHLLDPMLPEASRPTRRHLPELFLIFSRARTVGEATFTFSEIVRVVNEVGDAELEKVALRALKELLEYKNHPIDLLKEATDMDSTAAAYRQSLDDLVNQGIRRGREQGIRQGEKQTLVRMATMKFGRDAGEALSSLVGSSTEADLDGVAVAILESESASALLDRASNLPGQVAP